MQFIQNINILSRFCKSFNRFQINVKFNINHCFIFNKRHSDKRILKLLFIEKFKNDDAAIIISSASLPIDQPVSLQC